MSRRNQRPKHQQQVHPLPDGPQRQFIPTHRRRLYKLLAAVLPLCVLLLLEAGLSLGGYGYPTRFFLEQQNPAGNKLTSNPFFGRRFFPPALAREPLPQLLDAKKPPGTVRIVLLGESAALGDPEPAFGLARMLTVLLRQAYPDSRVEVINTAMTAINSHALLPIARDCAQLEADFWVVYAGNNEVVGPFGSGTVFGPRVPNLHLIRLALWLKTFKTGQLAGALSAALQGQSGPTAVWEGMEMFLNRAVRATDPQMQTVYHHFEHNLQDVLATGRKAGAKVIVCTVAVNLKDCAPFASQHREGWTPAEQAEWDRLVKAGDSLIAANNGEGALAQYQAALKMDAEYAASHFRVAECLSILGRFDQARRHYQAALEWDTLRFRADQRVNDLIRQCARGREAEGIFLVDAEQAIAAASPQQVPGRELFWEHVHFNFAGSYRLARAVAAPLARLWPQAGRAPAAAGREPESWLTLEDTAKKLAFTDWHQAQIIKEVRQRLSRPPFTNQANHAEQLQHLEAEQKRLGPELTPEKLPPQIAICRAAIAGWPEDWMLPANFADLLQSTGDLPGALREWQRVAELLPHHAPALYRCGDLLYRQGQSEAALPWYLRAKSAKPKAPEIWNGLGLCYLNLNRLEEASAHCAEAIRLNPVDPEYHFNQAIILVAQGRTNEAIAVYSENAEKHPQHQATYNNLGNLLARSGRFAEAEQVFAKLLRHTTNDAGAHNNYGSLLARQGKMEPAIAQFREALRLDPGNLEARFNLAASLAKIRQFDEAAAHYEALLAQKPDWPLVRQRLEQLRRLR